TAQRGKALLAPDEFFSVSLQEVVSQGQPNRFGEIELLVKFDKKIPNDTGRVELTVGTKTVTLLVGEYLPTDAARPAESDRLSLGFNANATAARAPGLKTRAALKSPWAQNFIFSTAGRSRRLPMNCWIEFSFNSSRFSSTSSEPGSVRDRVASSNSHGDSYG